MTANRFLSIQSSDILLRAGLQRIPWTNFKIPILPLMIWENYNHAGIALDSFNVHHIESRGYETISIKNYFSKENSKKGAVLRFCGPFSSLIRKHVSDIIRNRRYIKHIGNPFSSALDEWTINCNEFVFLIYNQALAEIFLKLSKESSDDLEKFKFYYLKGLKLKTKKIHLGYSFSALTALRMTAEIIAQSEITSDEVIANVEYRMKCIINSPLSDQKKTCLIFVFFLETFTPESFLSSKFFKKVGEFIH